MSVPTPALRAKIAEIKQSVASQAPFSSSELDSVILSLQGLLPSASAWDLSAVRALLARVAHTSHKDWRATEAAAADLRAIVGAPGDPAFDKAFERVLCDGGWGAALRAAGEVERAGDDGKPWAVLVTGVNGARKTTSVYEAWFCEALRAGIEGEVAEGMTLPSGRNSFFRQLDFLVASVANQEFAALYDVEDIGEYAALKDAVFARHRTIAEIFGALLVGCARDAGLSVMVETSGRDVGMFRYIEHFFGAGRADYRLMVIHFSVDDVRGAEESVRRRMTGEMRDGKRARGVREVVAANAGGPYGPEVLRSVQVESDAMWETVRGGTARVGNAWWKARLKVIAPSEGEWSVKAGEGERERTFLFAPR